MITASDIHYESGQHVQGLAGGGLGALLPVAETNERLHASVADSMFFESIADAGLGQQVGEGKAVITCEAGAESIQARQRVGFGVSGRENRDVVNRVDPMSDHALYYDGIWTKVHGAI